MNKKFFIIINVVFPVLFFTIFLSIIFNAGWLNVVDNTIGIFFKNCQNSFGNVFFTLISILTETVAILAYLLLLFMFKNRKKVALPLTVLVTISSFVGLIIKYSVQRTRPIFWFLLNPPFNYTFPTGFSFPSGHALNVTTFLFGLLFLVFINNKIDKTLKKILLIITSLLVLLVCLSRLWLGVHYFSDVVSGFLIAGILLNNFVYIYYNFLAKGKKKVK